MARGWFIYVHCSGEILRNVSCELSPDHSVFGEHGGVGGNAGEFCSHKDISSTTTTVVDGGVVVGGKESHRVR